MDEIRYFHLELDAKIGDEQYVHNGDEFEAYINDDVPDTTPDKIYPAQFKEEPYQGYYLPDINEIGRHEN